MIYSEKSVNHRKEILACFNTLLSEQQKTKKIISQIQKKIKSNPQNDVIYSKYRLLKQKLILANLEILRLNEKSK